MAGSPFASSASRSWTPGSSLLPVSQAASYVGDTSLAQSLWSTVTADKLVARVVVENAQGTRHADRRALAEHLREAILGRLQEDRA